MSAWLRAQADAAVCYLTTTGRRTGRPHRIEIWFATDGDRLYLLAGGREHADWVRNLAATPAVGVEIRDESHAGTARLLTPASAEDTLARRLVVDKYVASGESDLATWGRTALPVAIDFSL